MKVVAESLDSVVFCVRALAWKEKTGGRTKGVNGGLCTSWGNCIGKVDCISTWVEETFDKVSSTSPLISSSLITFSPRIVLDTCAKKTHVKILDARICIISSSLKFVIVGPMVQQPISTGPNQTLDRSCTKVNKIGIPSLSNFWPFMLNRNNCSICFYLFLLRVVLLGMSFRIRVIFGQWSIWWGPSNSSLQITWPWDSRMHEF